MANAESTVLDDLLSEPREALDIEVKEWLDLADNQHRAALAKEIIALANHGGGYLLVGFKEDAAGNFAPDLNRPMDLTTWSQDAVQSIIAKYVDPEVQCRVHHRVRPDAGEMYPIIVIPGGSRVPIRAKAGSPGIAPDNTKLVANRIYVRRAGPNSEEPRTAQEWDQLLETCMRQRQGELLEAMRSIINGVVPTVTNAAPTMLEKLAEFEADAVARWQKRVDDLPSDAPPRFGHGHYDLAIAINGDFDPPSLGALRDLIASAVKNHSGWPPFLTLSRAPFTPRPVDGAVEFWRGADNDGSYDRPAHHDFWRITPDGLLFTRRGYQEDAGLYERAPGTTFDITSATWRLGEAILEASYIARALGVDDGNLLCRASWTGLQGRELVSYGNRNRILFDGYKTSQDTYAAVQTIALNALPQALPEAAYAILAPLYETFDFFDLPKRLVEEELSTLQSRKF